MARPVEITQPSELIQCKPGESVTVGFTVSNIMQAAIQVGAQIQVEGSADADWFQLPDSSADWALEARESSRLDVAVTIPPGVPAQDCSFRLLVYLQAAPGEDFTKGEAVALQVVAMEKQVEASCWASWKCWRWVALGLVLLASGIGVYLGTRPDLVTLPDVRKMSATRALVELQKAGLMLGQLQQKVDNSAAVDSVLEQQPDPDDTPEVARGSMVDLTIASHRRIVIPQDKLKLKLFNSLDPKVRESVQKISPFFRKQED